MEDWNLSPKEAIARQRELREQTNLCPMTRPIQYIAGADISYNKSSDVIYAGVVVLDYQSMEVVQRSTVIDKMQFPYIPGLLSFREIPSILKAWKALPWQPDVIMMDGHGIAHPRRVGVATHFGLLTGCPSLGCAKKHLIGKYEEPAPSKGSFSPVFDMGEQIGYVVRTKDKVKQVWISPGHGMNLEQSREIALQCSRGYRIPEPTRQAHLMVNELRRGEKEAGVSGG